MPANAELLVDTSVAVALAVADHEHHEATVQAVGRRRLGLARLLSTSFPATRFLSARATAALLADLHNAGIAGGGVYDALVAAAAREHGAVLATRDHRALDTYRALEVKIELIG